MPPMKEPNGCVEDGKNTSKILNIMNCFGKRTAENMRNTGMVLYGH